MDLLLFLHFVCQEGNPCRLCRLFIDTDIIKYVFETFRSQVDGFSLVKRCRLDDRIFRDIIKCVRVMQDSRYPRDNLRSHHLDLLRLVALEDIVFVDGSEEVLNELLKHVLLL